MHACESLCASLFEPTPPKLEAFPILHDKPLGFHLRQAGPPSYSCTSHSSTSCGSTSIPCETYFSESLVPNLKRSLQHYLPLSGHLVYPITDNNKSPFSVTWRETQFPSRPPCPDKILTSSSRRRRPILRLWCRDGPAVKEGLDRKLIPTLSLKVTLFPDRGVCIGFSTYHCVGDASSTYRFVKAWSEIVKSGRADFLFPTFDRSFVQDPTRLVTVYWNLVRQSPLKPAIFPLPTNRVRATFTLDRANLEKLKGSVLAEKPSLGRVS
ncbi:HXXXD-type acyl-transferase family protein [Striga hermonthica]|uniref:HXXXD-type acyl-transferase family protein n=1 Tax=Striga hermonthica TaxID=68872 RepID=A0A9N7MWU7_STRHE|nr:HXXXD-type acyl-transferase family protein [Striga hermonthica]